jgi:hypothetical protein
MKESISAWLNSDRNFDTGISLLHKYGNKRLAFNLSGNEKKYTSKLAYHLARMLGYNIARAQKISLENRKAVSYVHLPAGKKRKPSAGSRKKKSGKQLPSHVRRLIHELNELFNDRAILHKQLGRIPEENTDENVSRRKEISDRMKEISDQMEKLYTAKDDYFSAGKLPDLTVLFPDFKKGDAKKKQMNGAGLMKRKKNLESSMTKDRNLLKYQSKIKLEYEDPMPEGPKRNVIENRIRNKQKELDEINELLK